MTLVQRGKYEIYIKYFLAYLSFFAGIGLIIFSFLGTFKYYGLELTFVERDLISLGIFPLFYVYHKLKPFKITGGLDLYLKEKWNNYLDSQKTCLNCNKVVKSSEIKNGVCKSCRDLDKKSPNIGYKRKDKNE
ncbi:hypothetical protein [Aliarcobacter cryaerophilus]|uniref:Uncharacterized protein n=1 Tax=Aliarcobacter cryaerophilus ATCC 43158 TaxID=1032070 RepID=A0AAD0X9T1_9BACT|nr:hypothetical protein [Aliarcobacter cryaerophilus]AYJ80425.1 hypothetical protein ACRYA_1301 [Aliarcobacter cryaerophilus ATCC 43158]